MTVEDLKGKDVEVFLVGKGFRFTGRCEEITNGFITLRSDKDGRLLLFNLTSVENIKEVIA